MTARTLEAFRWEKFVFIVFAPFSVGLLCLWGFAVEIRDQKDANVPRLTVDASADARRYIVQHPMDSVGWLALAESALIAESNKPPSFAATQAIAIAAVLRWVDRMQTDAASAPRDTRRTTRCRTRYTGRDLPS